MLRKTTSRYIALVLAGLTLAACGNDSGSSAQAAGDGAGFSDAQRGEIAKLVRETLIKHPEILQEAFAALEKKDQAEQAKRADAALAASAQQLFHDKNSPVAGDAKGDVTIVEFFDYNCPYCRKAFRDLDKVMKDDPKVRVVFKEFPIFGGASLVAAKAALAADKQGKYFQFHEALLAGEGRITANTVFDVAKKVGLDIDKLKSDMQSKDIQEEISRNEALAGKLGIRGTPAFFVGDQLIPGAPENLAKLLEAKVASVRKNGCKHC